MPTFKPGEELSKQLGGFNAHNDCGQFIDMDNPRFWSRRIAPIARLSITAAVLLNSSPAGGSMGDLYAGSSSLDRGGGPRKLRPYLLRFAIAVL